MDAEKSVKHHYGLIVKGLKTSASQPPVKSHCKSRASSSRPSLRSAGASPHSKRLRSAGVSSSWQPLRFEGASSQDIGRGTDEDTAVPTRRLGHRPDLWNGHTSMPYLRRAPPSSDSPRSNLRCGSSSSLGTFEDWKPHSVLENAWDFLNEDFNERHGLDGDGAFKDVGTVIGLAPLIEEGEWHLSDIDFDLAHCFEIKNVWGKYARYRVCFLANMLRAGVPFYFDVWCYYTTHNTELEAD